MVRHNAISTVHILFILLFHVLGYAPYVQVIKPVSCIKSPTLRCSETERTALLSFKQGLIDPSGRLSSWVGDDCCNWEGVACENYTGKVVKLDLRNPFPVYGFDSYYFIYDEIVKAYEKSCLRGKISSSILHLKHLSYLDLSLNNFTGNHIPKFLGSIGSLRYLNLSCSLFAGDIPPHLGNLSSLQYLDLNSFPYSIPFFFRLHFDANYPKLKVKSLQWFTGFPLLKYLNMGGVALDNVENWPIAVNIFPFLLELHLSGCGLVLPNSISTGNLTLLSVLDLSKIHFESSILYWVSNLSHLSSINLESSFDRGAIPDGLGHLANLQNLNLGDTLLEGKIPSSFVNLCKLKTLRLRYTIISGELTKLVDGLSHCSNNKSNLENQSSNFNSLLGGNLKALDVTGSSIGGSIPKSIGNLSSLEELCLSSTQMKGVIPKGIGKLSMLVHLHLEKNSWEGVITETHFQNLTRLKYLMLSTRPSTKLSLVLDIKYDWIPPFKLIVIQLAYIQVGPKFPMWLKTQNELTILSLQNGCISDTIPPDLWNSCSNVIVWSLAHNMLQGQVPYFQFHHNTYALDLSFNNLEGPLPLFPCNLTLIILCNNMFSTPIPRNINVVFPKLIYLDLSSNKIVGRIPHSIGMLKELVVLVLKNNFLTGNIPSQWKDLHNLEVLDLASNNLSGTLPRSMRHLSQLELLSLGQNHLEGKFPSFFRNYRYLIQLDLGGNKFNGELLTWIGESLSSLSRLSLRLNLFEGAIPLQLCLLSRLKVLDLAFNNFLGVIPLCLGNLSISSREQVDYMNDEQMVLHWKGREDLHVNTNLLLFYSIDLSGNNLSGEMPESITSLFKLVNLNLSRNHLSGRIPEKIGNLRMLESLDLSKNELFGHIPDSLSSLNFLSCLNLSFNNLSGKIPQGNQLQTLIDSSIYEGNPLLCGPPLSIKCSKNEIKPKVIRISKNGLELSAFYISMIIGFIFGCWGVCCTLIVKPSWRQTYFGCFVNLKDKIIAFIIVKVVCLLRKV